MVEGNIRGASILNILVIGAHFDDEILGCGGSVLKWIKAGNKVYTCVVTDSCSTQYPGNLNVLQEKQDFAADLHKQMGVIYTYTGGVPEMILDIQAIAGTVKIISQAIQQCRPEAVFTHHPGDLNADHRRTFEATMVATRPTADYRPSVFCYEIPSTTEWNPIGGVPFVPTYYEDITEFLEEKISRFSKYDMEVRPYPHPRSLEKIRSHAESRGAEIQVKAAEAFEVARLVK
jgi:LmbE family N-acetylglucosaminyl deacetylase